MTSAYRCVLAFVAIFALSPVFADAGQAPPYAGEDQRAIKALSAGDVQGLRDGAGLGYAKAAELNGWPGPLHALELREALSLSEAQVQRMEALRREMKADAVPLGRQLIEAERALDTLFASGTPTAEDVAAATARIGEIEGRLRAVHLVAHLRAAPVLTRHQTMLYVRARGYSGMQGHGGHSHGG
jgi:Spy/CpxP family protein refolding chaperone